MVPRNTGGGQNCSPEQGEPPCVNDLTAALSADLYTVIVVVTVIVRATARKVIVTVLK